MQNKPISTLTPTKPRLIPKRGISREALAVAYVQLDAAVKDKGGRPTREDAKLTEGYKTRWLEAYVELGWERACRKVGISVSTPSNWKRIDPAFKENFEASQEAVTDRFEAILESVILGDRVLDKNAAVLLIFKLKGLKPSVYRDRYHVEVGGSNGNPIEIKKAGDASRGMELLKLWEAAVQSLASKN